MKLYANNSAFINNKADVIICDWYNYANVENCNFTDNNASIVTGTKNLVNCNMINNYGSYLIQEVEENIFNCNVQDNVALDWAICNVKNIKDSVFKNNMLINENGYGGVLSNCENVYDCTFINNSIIGAFGYGGALNQCYNVSNCIFVNCSAQYGGAIYNSVAMNCNFTDCSAQYGGALYDSSAINCTFVNCSAQYGGAIYDSVAMNCNFTDCSAQYGGALYDSSAINCTFVNCSAQYGGAIYDFNAVNCTFTGCSATISGNNICLKMFTTLITSDVSMYYNDAKYLVVKVRDSNKKAISGAQVTIKLNGVTKSLKTDANGQVKLLINLAPNSYKATITFPAFAKSGDNTIYHAKQSASAKVTVKKATPKLSASSKTYKSSLKTKKYSVVLKDNKNKPLKNTKVVITVNGKSYAAKTNSKGQATFKITNLNKAGSFKATVKYGGSKYYNAISKKVTIKVKK